MYNCSHVIDSYTDFLTFKDHIESIIEEQRGVSLEGFDNIMEQYVDVEDRCLRIVDPQDFLLVNNTQSFVSSDLGLRSEETTLGEDVNGPEGLNDSINDPSSLL